MYKPLAFWKGERFFLWPRSKSDCPPVFINVIRVRLDGAEFTTTDYPSRGVKDDEGEGIGPINRGRCVDR